MLKDSRARSRNPKGYWQGALFLKSIISVPLFQSPPPLICPQDCPQIPKGRLGLLWDVSNYGLKKQFVLFAIVMPVPFLLSRKKMHPSLLLPHKASQGSLKPYSLHLAFLKSDLKIWHPNINIWTFRFQTRHKSNVAPLSSELSLGLPLWQGENIIRTPPPYPHFALCGDRSSFESTLWPRVHVPWSLLKCAFPYVQRDKGAAFYSQALCYLNKVIGCLMNVSCSTPCGQRGCCLMNCLMCLITVTMLNEEKAREIWKIHWRIWWKWIGSIGTFCSSLNGTLWAVLLELRDNAILWLVVFL